MSKKITAANDLFANRHGGLVEAGSEAKTLVARAGRVVPERYADAVNADGTIKQKKKAKPRSKAKKPAATKVRKGAEDK